MTSGYRVCSVGRHRYDLPEAVGLEGVGGGAEEGMKKWWRVDDGLIPIRIDTGTPSPARVYDYLLGGKDNFAVDREAGDKVIAALPDSYEGVWENRRFLQRAVRYLTEQGVRQFVDVGAGLPTQGNVHEIAQQHIPDAHVVYVDNDPIVLAHARALLAADDTTEVIQSDIRDPVAILDHPELRRLIDWDQPVAVLMVAILHFVTDEYDPDALVRTFVKAMAPGSALVLTHLTTDGPTAAAVETTVAAYEQASEPIVFRPRERIEGFFTGLEQVPPGLTRPWEWPDAERPDAQGTKLLYAGVARKP
jgi:SAM-dependent methyltransferase